MFSSNKKPSYARRTNSSIIDPSTTPLLIFGCILLTILGVTLFFISLHTSNNNLNNNNLNLETSSLSNNLLSLSRLDKLKQVTGTYDDIHVVVTTGCNGYQNWQSELLLYSWALIKQPGRFTRIVAGCKTKKDYELANRTAIPDPENRISTYFVDDYTPNEPKQFHPFHYFNKPFGMNKWLNEKKDEIYESVIVLIDPDMIITKQFLFHIKIEADKHAQLQFEKMNNKQDLYVRQGHPVSQKYGIGAKWVSWKGFCDDNPNCKVSDSDGWKYYSVGPPYIMHKNDWLKVAPKWVEFSPHALELEPQPSILAEMYSFVIACAYFNLKHSYLLSMISDPGANMESWKMLKFNFNNIDINGDRKKEDQYDIIDFHIIHYCQGFWLGKTRNEGTIRNGGWNWHKGHVPQEILYNCEIPLLVELRDDNNENYNIYKIRDESKNKNENDGKYRHTWVLYHIYKYLNKAVINYRIKYCNENWNKEFKLVLQQPEADVNGRRMNYVLNDYDSGKSWFGH